jgi:hypothetical protein
MTTNKSIPHTPRQRAVVLFSDHPRMTRERLVEALTGIGPNHPAWHAVRQLLCDHWTGWNEASLATSNAGTPIQSHACGAQSGLAELLADLDELMERAVEVLESDGDVEP